MDSNPSRVRNGSPYGGLLVDSLLTAVGFLLGLLVGLIFGYGLGGYRTLMTILGLPT